MSRMLVKPTSDPEVEERAKMIADLPPGVRETLCWGVGKDMLSPSRQRLGVSPDSCACQAPGGLGPCGRTMWFEPPWMTVLNNVILLWANPAASKVFSSSSHTGRLTF